METRWAPICSRFSTEMRSSREPNGAQDEKEYGRDWGEVEPTTVPMKIGTPRAECADLRLRMDRALDAMDAEAGMGAEDVVVEFGGQIGRLTQHGKTRAEVVAFLRENGLDLSPTTLLKAIAIVKTKSRRGRSGARTKRAAVQRSEPKVPPAPPPVEPRRAAVPAE